MLVDWWINLFEVNLLETYRMDYFNLIFRNTIMKYYEFVDPETLSYLDTPKYSLSEVFEVNHSSDEVKKYTLIFHDKLVKELNRRKLFFKSKTNIYGISYFCTPRKAFIWLGAIPETMTLRYFTGGRRIAGLEPGPWINKQDDQGSKPLHVNSDRDLEEAIRIALESYKISHAWTSLKRISTNENWKAGVD